MHRIIACMLTIFVAGLFGKLARAEQSTGEDADESILTIGAAAPPIDIQHWIQNPVVDVEPVTHFQPGKVYVINFWATWCKPCLKSMPHLAGLQKQYADKGVQIISVSDEEPRQVEQFLADEVPQYFLSSVTDRESLPANQTEGQTFQDTTTYRELTSAYCLTTDPDRSVDADYMDASQSRGIPTAFLVGKTGLIEWIGHPEQLDQPLRRVVDDQWDRAAALHNHNLKRKADRVLSDLAGLMQLERHQTVLTRIADLDAELLSHSDFSRQVDRYRLLALANLGKLDQARERFETMLADEEFDANSLLSVAIEVFKEATLDEGMGSSLGPLVLMAANKAVDRLQAETPPKERAEFMQIQAMMVAEFASALDAVAIQKQAIELVPKNDQAEFARNLNHLIAASKSVAGWLPSGTCDLSSDQGHLLITSTGADPYLSFRFPYPVQAQDLTLHVTLKSNSFGEAQLFWKGIRTQFSPDSSQIFDIKHDDQFHQYQIKLSSQNPVTMIRLDPSQGKGRIEISSMRLVTRDDGLVYRWSF